MMFAHRLALKLGEVDVDAMLARIPRRVFLRWWAYYLLEPWDRAELIALAETKYKPPRWVQGKGRFLTADEFSEILKAK